MTTAQTNLDQTLKIRELIETTPGLPTIDGDGVRMTRIIGSPQLDMIDPFLLLDLFESDNPDDYIGGFPNHPHRGFETVTYLLDGRMRHKDNVGHEGVIEPGGAQWMTAGRGIVHSEMPEQEDGLLKGFQLWINLPASEKMQKPRYQEFTPDDIPVETDKNGTSIKVIAGTSDQGTTGPVAGVTSAPLYLDVTLGSAPDIASGDTVFRQSVPATHNAIIYVIDGSVRIGHQNLELPTGYLGILGPGEQIEVTGQVEGSRFLLIAAKRLDEPVARGGPFVMNTKAELLQAFSDFRNGQF